MGTSRSCANLWGVRLQTLMKLRKIRRELRKSDRQYYRTLRKSGKKQEECTGETWYLDWMIDNIWSEAQERKAISDELEYQAQKLYLPTPSLDNEEDWDTDHANPPTRFLTAKAMSELRSAIRKERAERRAVIEWWLKALGGLIGVVTGLVGALIGLFAIWKK